MKSYIRTTVTDTVPYCKMAIAKITALFLFLSFIAIGSSLTGQDELPQILTDIIDNSYAQADNYDTGMNLADYNELKDYAAGEKVQIRLYYEVFCPKCVEFDTTALKEAILNLGQYIDIYTYPYGNARTMTDANGRITFQCQHGPPECYGNMLHACALDIIPDRTQALLYNSCMMEPTQGSGGSDDQAADRCAYQMQLNPEPIKSCAKGNRGVELLYYYGEESRKVYYEHVPYILVNNKVSNGDNFLHDICSSFTSPPAQCSQY